VKIISGVQYAKIIKNTFLSNDFNRQTQKSRSIIVILFLW